MEHIDICNLADQFFVSEERDGHTYFVLNKELSIPALDPQDGAKLLIQVIRTWHERRSLFCHDNTETWQDVEGSDKRERVQLPEDRWSFDFKSPSDCSGCVSAQRLAAKCFGNFGAFTALPFVVYHGSREYSFRFDLLTLFASDGKEAVEAKIREEKEAAARKKAVAEEEARRAREAKQRETLAALLNGMEIHPELEKQLISLANERPAVVHPDVAVIQTSRSEYGSSGGIGYFSGVRVLFRGQSQEREWQWRDRYSASNDRPHLSIHGIGAVQVERANGKATVTVELKNRTHGSRSTAFTFDVTDDVPASRPQLSSEQQVAFRLQVEAATQRATQELEHLWTLKPGMLDDRGPATYYQPRITAQEMLLEYGIAVFITEEQIDHRGTDRQMRFNLHLVRFSVEGTERIAEDHGYEREGGAMLRLVRLAPDSITISTKSGNQTIALA